MKQLTKNMKICIIAVITLIILAGIVVINILGFNKELKYSQGQSIEIYIEQEIDKAKVQNIINEVLGKSNMVQTVEIYEDMIAIKAKNISDEQKNDIVNKIKENYEFAQTAEETEITTVAATRIRDMYKKYIIPFAISGIIVLMYMLIRYYNRGIWKVLARTTIIPIVAQLLLLSIIAITRIPVGRFIPVLVIVMYVLSILYVIKENEK